MSVQLAKVARLRTICIVDVARYGEKLLEAGADLLVDRRDPERAIEIIRGVTKGRLRLALDTVGKDTAEKLQQALFKGEGKCHLVGLTGLPNVRAGNVLYHSVPIKAFHDIPKIGESLMTWLERVLLAERLIAPETETAVGGLSGINTALDLLREGTLTGKRIVVPLHKDSLIAAS